MPRSPIFLVGAERSGSTLLRLMLDSHPDITGTEGFEFMVDLVGDDGALPSAESYRTFLETHNIFSSSRLEVDWSLDYPDLVDDFLEQRLRLSGKSQVASMVHFGFHRLRFIWPEARYIHLLRDPRDVANSVVQMGWAGNVYAGASKWVESEEQWAELRPHLDAGQFLEVRFADLVGNHVATLERICAFLGVEYTDAMLDYAHDTAYDVPNPERINSWDRTLEPTQIALVEERVGQLLEARGFAPSGVPTIEWNRFQWARLHLTEKVNRFRAGAAKYGWPLMIEMQLSRLLPFESYRKSVVLRYNAKERAQRKRSWRSPDREFSVR